MIPLTLSIQNSDYSPCNSSSNEAADVCDVFLASQKFLYTCPLFVWAQAQ